MKFEFAIPSSILQPYIKQYWAIENVLNAGKEHMQRIVATGLPELTFYFADRPKSANRSFDANTLLSGQQNDFYDLLITDKLSMFSVTFQPNGLSHFLRMPISELRNQTVSVHNIESLLASHLEEQLAEMPTFQQRIEIVEQFFFSKLKHQIVSVDHERMRHAIELIKSTKGNTSIGFLASNACLSRKQFERIFLSHIGISPKQFLKIIRFQNAISLKQNSYAINLTKLAYEAGYYDQSHFINEIKELTGQTPKTLFKNEDIISDFFR